MDKALYFLQAGCVGKAMTKRFKKAWLLKKGRLWYKQIPNDI
jgi:hypothetical protein